MADGIDFVDKLEKLNDELQRLSKEIDRLSSTNGDDVFDKMGKSLSMLSDKSKDVVEKLASFGSAKQGIDDYAKNIENVISLFESRIESLERKKTLLAQMQSSANESGNGRDALSYSRQYAEVETEILSCRESVQKLKDEQISVTDKIHDSEAAFRGFGSTLSKDDVITATNTIKEQLDKIQESEDGAVEKANELVSALSNMEALYETAGKGNGFKFEMGVGGNDILSDGDIKKAEEQAERKRQLSLYGIMEEEGRYTIEAGSIADKMRQKGKTIEEILDAIEKRAKETKIEIPQENIEGTKTIIDRLAELDERLKKTRDSFTSIRESMNSSTAIEGMGNAISSLGEKSVSVTDKILQFKEAEHSMNIQSRNVSDALALLENEMLGLAQRKEVLSQAISESNSKGDVASAQEYQKQFADTQIRLMECRDSFVELQKEQAKIRQETKSGTSAFNKFQESLSSQQIVEEGRKIQELMASLISQGKSATETYERLGGVLETLNIAQEKVEKKSAENNDVKFEFGASTADLLSDEEMARRNDEERKKAEDARKKIKDEARKDALSKYGITEQKDADGNVQYKIEANSFAEKAQGEGKTIEEIIAYIEKKLEDERKRIDEIFDSSRQDGRSAKNAEKKVSASDIAEKAERSSMDYTTEEVKGYINFKPQKATIDEIESVLRRIQIIVPQIQKEAQKNADTISSSKEKIKQTEEEVKRWKSIANNSDSTKEQKEQAKRNIEELEKVLERYGRVLKRQEERQRAFNKELEGLGKAGMRASDELEKKGVRNPVGDIFKTKDSTKDFVQAPKLEKEHTKLSKSLDNLKEKSDGVLKSFAGVGAGFAQMKNGFNTMANGGMDAAKGLAMVRDGVNMVGVSLKALFANPIILAIAAIIAVISFLAKSLQTFFNETWEGRDMLARFTGTLDGLKAALDNLMINIGRDITIVAKFFDDLKSALVASFNTPIATIKAAWNGVVDYFVGITSGIGKIVRAVFSGNWKELNNTISHAFDEVNFKETIVNGIKDAYEEAKEIASKAWDGMSDVAKKNLSFDTFVNAYKRASMIEIELEKLRLKNQLVYANLNAQIASNRDKMYSGSKAEQKFAIEETKRLNAQKFAMKRQELQMALEAQQIRLNAQGANKKQSDLKKEGDLREQLINLNAQEANSVMMTSRRYKSLENQINSLNIEREKLETSHNTEMEISALKFRLGLEGDLNDRLKTQNELREKNLQKQLDGIELDKKAKIKDWYGEDAVKYYSDNGNLDGYEKKDNNGKTMFVGDEYGVLDLYNKKAQFTIEKSNQEGIYKNLNDDISAYKNFSQEIVEIAKWRKEQIESIAKGESMLSVEDIDKITAQKTNNSAMNNNIDTNEEAFANKVAKYVTDMQTASADTIIALMDGFVEGMDLDKLKSYANMDEEQKIEEKANLVYQLGESADYSDEEKLLILERLKELEMEQADLLVLISNRENAINIIRKEGVKALENSDNRQKKSRDELVNHYNKIAEGFDGLSKSVRAVDNLFGKSLSKNSNKALKSILSLSDGCKTAFGSIASLIPQVGTMVSAVTKGMETEAIETTATLLGVSKATATAIKTVEAASVILAVISAILQTLEAIAKALVDVFTDTSDQDYYDRLKKELEETKTKLDDIDWSASMKKGTAYWRETANAAKQASEVANKAQEAYRQALKMSNQYSKSDDSKKAEDAREQAQEAKEAYQDAMSDLQKRKEELFEGLSGTSLDDFSRSLAESLVEGFSDGMGDIEDEWEDFMKNLEKTMMTNALSNALSDMFQSTFDNMQRYANDGQLSQAEMDAMVSELDAKSAQAKQLAELYYNLMNERGLLDDEDAEGTNGFGQMTQDTADALNARFTALQMEGANVVNSMQIMQPIITELGNEVKLQSATLNQLLINSNLAMQMAQEQLDQLVLIAGNTALLRDTNDYLNSIRQNTSKL